MRPPSEPPSSSCGCTRPKGCCLLLLAAACCCCCCTGTRVCTMFLCHRRFHCTLRPAASWLDDVPSHWCSFSKCFDAPPHLSSSKGTAPTFLPPPSPPRSCLSIVINCNLVNAQSHPHRQLCLAPNHFAPKYFAVSRDRPPQHRTFRCASRADVWRPGKCPQVPT